MNICLVLVKDFGQHKIIQLAPKTMSRTPQRVMICHQYLLYFLKLIPGCLGAPKAKKLKTHVNCGKKTDPHHGSPIPTTSKIPTRKLTQQCNLSIFNRSYSQMLIRMSNHILSIVFSFHAPILSFGEPGFLYVYYIYNMHLQEVHVPASHVTLPETNSKRP